MRVMATGTGLLLAVMKFFLKSILMMAAQFC